MGEYEENARAYKKKGAFFKWALFHLFRDVKFLLWFFFVYQIYTKINIIKKERRRGACPPRVAYMAQLDKTSESSCARGP